MKRCAVKNCDKEGVPYLCERHWKALPLATRQCLRKRDDNTSARYKLLRRAIEFGVAPKLILISEKVKGFPAINLVGAGAA